MVKREKEGELAAVNAKKNKHDKKSPSKVNKINKNAAVEVAGTELEIKAETVAAAEDDDDDYDDDDSLDIEGNVERIITPPPTITSTPTAKKEQQTSSPPTTSAAAARNLSKKSSSFSSTTSTPSKSSTVTTPTNASLLSNNAAANKKSKKRKDSGTSSDEERWLSAIEAGKIEDVDDELKKMKDPKLMTARQRAMYERGNDKDACGTPSGEYLMSLPIGYREKEKPQTAEDIQKHVLRTQKRKQMADAKREKDKKKTMERLLKKQESKQRSTGRNKLVKLVQPMLRYSNTSEGVFMHLPTEHTFPLQAQSERPAPKRQLCGIDGCQQPKVYNCSKTNVPLCSYECYRKNVEAARQMIS